MGGRGEIREELVREGGVMQGVIVRSGSQKTQNPPQGDSFLVCKISPLHPNHGERQVIQSQLPYPHRCI